MTPRELAEAQALVDALPEHQRRLEQVKADDATIGNLCRIADGYEFDGPLIRACRPLLVAEIEERITAARRRLRQLGVTLS